MITHFINNLKTLEESTRPTQPISLKEAQQLNAISDSNVVRSLEGKIVLDPRKDPDPYGLHNIPLSVRLQYMGWN